MIQIDLPMPQACDVCPLNYDFCWCKGFKDNEFDKWSDDWNDQVCEGERRPEYCPLKEQEAVEPVTESSVYDPDTWFFVCGSCKKGVIDRGDKFCRWCGQAVKWE